ncbi:MAG: VanZ family protein [Flavobacterium sp.]|nr:MAG: VanZ family protein [Flavobacterium sp.]
MPNRFLLGAVTWTFFITVSCLISVDSFGGEHGIGIDIPNSDKFVHFLFYFIFTLLWYRCFKAMDWWPLRKTKIIVFMFAVSYGILIEICQGVFTSYRSADVLDAVANTSGSAFGILTMWLLERNKNTNRSLR